MSGEELLICFQSKQAADDGDRWSRFPGKFKPVVEEAIGYHGDWLGGMGRRWGGRSVLLKVSLTGSADEGGGAASGVNS